MEYADRDQLFAGSHLDDNGNGSVSNQSRKTVKVVRGAYLKDQDFPLDVRFGGGWKQIHYVSTEVFRREQIVRLWDRDNREIAKIYPDSEIRIRVEL